MQAAESSPPADESSSEEDESSLQELEEYQYHAGQQDRQPLEAARKLHSLQNGHTSYDEPSAAQGDIESGNDDAADRLSDKLPDGISPIKPAGATADTIVSKAGQCEHLGNRRSSGSSGEHGFDTSMQGSSFTAATSVPAVPALPAMSTRRSSVADETPLSSFAASLLPDKGQSRAGSDSVGPACTARDDDVPLAPPSPELSPDRSAISPPTRWGNHKSFLTSLAVVITFHAPPSSPQA